jgi:hypothetical protein
LPGSTIAWRFFGDSSTIALPCGKPQIPVEEELPENHPISWINPKTLHLPPYPQFWGTETLKVPYGWGIQGVKGLPASTEKTIRMHGSLLRRGKGETDAVISPSF